MLHRFGLRDWLRALIGAKSFESKENIDGFGNQTSRASKAGRRLP
jgi:hypothetical protein